MDTRRLIAFGDSSHVISLPKQWIKSNNLKKGDIVYLDAKNNEISLFTSERPIETEAKEITINIEKDDIDLARTKIVSAYLNNYDSIIIKNPRGTNRAKEIKNILRNLTGMEIIRETSESITAKDLLNKREISINTLVRRVDNLLRDILHESEKINKEVYENIFDRDKDVNRMVFLGFRLINAAISDKSLANAYKLSNTDLLYMNIILTKMEKIGDQAKRIVRYLSDCSLTKAEVDELLSIYKIIINGYIDIMKGYHTSNIDIAFQYELESQKWFDMINAIKPIKCANASRGIEHMKGMATAVKNISRGIIGLKGYPAVN